MAVEQTNFSYFLYVDDNATNWNVKGEDGGPGAGVDGHTTDYTAPAFGKATRLRHPRYAVYQDATTFRTYRTVVYTPTAFAAIGAGDTLTVAVPGSATEVTYTLAAKIAEKLPIPRASKHLTDHA